MADVINFRTDGESRISMCFAKEGKRAFFLKCYVEELERELNDIKEAFDRNKSAHVSIERLNGGVYMISAKEQEAAINDFDAWDILMHKYMSLSHQVVKEGNVKYYCVRFSDEKIPENAPRALAV